MSDLLKRQGIFKVSNSLIKDNPEGIIEALKDVLVVRVDNDFMTKMLIYYGYSKHFDLAEEGEIPLEYMAEIDTSNGKIEITWHKKRFNINY